MYIIHNNPHNTKGEFNLGGQDMLGTGWDKHAETLGGNSDPSVGGTAQAGDRKELDSSRTLGSIVFVSVPQPLCKMRRGIDGDHSPCIYAKPHCALKEHFLGIGETGCVGP